MFPPHDQQVIDIGRGHDLMSVTQFFLFNFRNFRNTQRHGSLPYSSLTYANNDTIMMLATVGKVATPYHRATKMLPLAHKVTLTTTSSYSHGIKTKY